MVDAVLAVLYVYAFIRQLIAVLYDAFNKHVLAHGSASSRGSASRTNVSKPAPAPPPQIRAPEQRDVFVKRRDPQYRVSREHRAKAHLSKCFRRLPT